MDEWTDGYDMNGETCIWVDSSFGFVFFSGLFPFCMPVGDEKMGWIPNRQMRIQYSFFCGLLGLRAASSDYRQRERMEGRQHMGSMDRMGGGEGKRNDEKVFMKSPPIKICKISCKYGI